MRYAYLPGATLHETKLDDVDLGNALLTDADLSGAEIRKANLKGAKIYRAEFFETQLAESDFTESELSGTAFKNVDLRQTVITQGQLDKTFGDGSVKLPDHLQRPDFWPKEDLDWIEFEARWRAWREERGYVTDTDDD